MYRRKVSSLILQAGHFWSLRYRRCLEAFCGPVLIACWFTWLRTLAFCVGNVSVSVRHEYMMCKGEKNALHKDACPYLHLFKNSTVEICGLLGNYTASCDNYLPTFRDNVSVPSSRVKIPRWPVKMGTIRCPETSVNNYHTTPCNYPEDHIFYQHRGGRLKSNSTVVFPDTFLLSYLKISEFFIYRLTLHVVLKKNLSILGLKF
jgi:hypothetical protein